MPNMLAVTGFEQEETFAGTPGEDVNAQIRFDPETYDRYVIVSAFGAAPFNGSPGANGGTGEYGGIIVERLDGGKPKMANHCVEVHASSATFYASVTEAFFIAKDTSRLLTFKLALQGVKTKFLPATLRIQHATLKVT